ncbi:DUF3861 domain-containing protein [Pseudomonas bijieensis]|uniref:DUF3861 domain-containing protein n=1 Tax=Pseudomonas bijieensis TaxID=2681983 RepID=UPI00200D68FE|nr:DUF3861 domain-containing protein [Pseudomonas bijieensis]UQI28474.1 DUF3861 domain-containing protein [Pseudomonas bijieensis]
MKANHYQISIQPLDEQSEGAPPALQFEFVNHDDLLHIVELLQAGLSYAPASTAALAIGVKLFSAVMLANRYDPLFADIDPAMRTFIRKLKQRVSAVSLTSGATQP